MLKYLSDVTAKYENVPNIFHNYTSAEAGSSACHESICFCEVTHKPISPTTSNQQTCHRQCKELYPLKQITFVVLLCKKHASALGSCFVTDRGRGAVSADKEYATAETAVQPFCPEFQLSNSV